MRLAGAIIALIAGIFATFAAGFTLFVGGVGGALQADRAGLVVSLGWGGVAFSFVTIVLAAIGIGNKTRTPGFLLILSSIAGAILGGTMVAVFMALALIGGILVAIGGNSSSTTKHSPVKAHSTRQCIKCNSTIATGQAFCGSCGTPVASFEQGLFSGTAAPPSEPIVPNSALARTSPTSKKANSRNWLAWVGGGIVVGLVGLFGALAIAANSGNTTIQAEADDPIAALAEEFKLGDLAVTVSKAEFRRFVGAGPFRQESSPTSVYLVVEYSYRNEGSRPLGIFETPKVSLRDELGVKYSPDVGAGAAHATEGSSNAKILSGLNPGVTITESDVFEIDAASAQSSSYSLTVEAGRHKAIIRNLAAPETPAVVPATPTTPSSPPFMGIDVSADVVTTSAGPIQFSEIARQHHDEFTEEDSLFGRAEILSAYDFRDGVVLALFEKNGGGSFGIEYFMHRISSSGDEIVLDTLATQVGNLTEELSLDVDAWGYMISSDARSAWTCRYYFDPVSRRLARAEFASNPDNVDARVCSLEK